MQNDPPERPAPLDEETLAFAQRVFDHARAGRDAELAELLAMGLPANLRDHKGDSLLMLASYHGHPDAARRLLEHGADPELANDRGQTPLAGAAFKGDAAMARLLLEKGAAVDGSGPDGKTALMIAAMFDRMEIIDLLLAAGADPQAQDVTGLTAADAAQKMGAQNAWARLKQYGSG
jgi:uncharacterized protein